MRTVVLTAILVCACVAAQAQTETPTPAPEPSPQAWSSAPIQTAEPIPPTDGTDPAELRKMAEAAAAAGAGQGGDAAKDAVADVFDLDAMCLDCHRLGQPRVEAPLLEGQHRDYLRNQLVRFQERHRDSFPMSSVVAGMDQATLRGLADQLSLRKWPALRMSVAEPAVARGRERAATLACNSCHGDGFMGTGDIPRLAGQHPGYLGRQLADIAAERRYHPPSGIGVPLSRLDEADIANLAAFLHAKGSTPPP